MTKITYIQSDGAARTVNVKDGWTVMEGAVRNDVRGIDAECGGACACATCRVIVDTAWVGRLGVQGAMEKDMLSVVGDAEANSRLSCQLRVTPEMEGLVVSVPQTQTSAL